MAAQQWLGEINQFIFVFCTEQRIAQRTVKKKKTKQQEQEQNALSRKEKVYNKKQHWGEPNNESKGSANA